MYVAVPTIMTATPATAPIMMSVRVLSLSSSSFELELSPDPPFGVEVVGVEGALVTGVSGELVVGDEGALVTGVSGELVVGVEGAPVTGVSVGELVVGASVGVLGVEVVGDGSLPPLTVTSHDTSMFAHPNASDRSTAEAKIQ